MQKHVEVVLIEDDPYDAELLMRVFKKHNFAGSVVFLKDGVEALDYFFKNINMVEWESKSRIVFLDLKMPRVDGIEVLRRLKSDSRTAKIPIVILTGSKEERDLKNAHALGVTSYITKPLKSEQFVLLMSELGGNLDVIDRQVRILVFEDNPGDAELIRRELEKSICNIAVELAQDKSAFQEALSNFAPDIILADYSVPGFNGIAAMYLARQSFPDIPVIIVSGTIGEETAIEALKSGANDYVLKSRLSRLGPVTNRSLQEAKQLAERKKAEEELIATKDRLINELAGSSRLHEMSVLLVSQTDMKSLYDEFLKAAIELTHADMGNMQLVDEDGNLKIIAQHGFSAPFLEFFSYVTSDSHASCGKAQASKKRVIVEDTTTSPIFVGTPSLKVLLDAGIRACQSTPLITRSGELIGVINTHYRKPHVPDDSDLRFLDLLVRQAADIIEHMQTKQKLDLYAKNLEKLVDERTGQLAASERLAAIGATAGMVGHDIRNPLQAITSDIYLAKSELTTFPEGSEKENLKESLEGIEANVEYINKIVQDLQDYARPLNPTAKETDFEALCQEVLFKNGVPKYIDAACKVEDEAKMLIIDAALLKRLMSNLVSNAVQAMPNGGKLWIHAYQEANDIMITIEDTGVGIPNEVKPKLFTPLFTTKAKGQGFGLSVVKRFAEALGGTVSLESEVGKGTKFIIRFPPPQVNGTWTCK